MQLSLERILQTQGFGTRRECRLIIEGGEVVVGGQTIERPSQSFEAEGLEFSVFGEEHLWRAKVYLAMNKPAGHECSRKPSHHPGVMSLLPENMTLRDVQAVGRLDHDTTGLLLLSDDGAFIHRMTSPRHHVPKRYLATTAEAFSQNLIDRLLQGVQLHDEPAPLAVSACTRVDDHRLEVVLEQGKYHQVRRMLAAAGHHCAALERIAIGRLTLASLGLEPGEWCYLEEADLQLLNPEP